MLNIEDYLHVNVEFEDNVWWRPSYYPFDNRELLKNVEKCTSIIKQIRDGQDFEKDSNDFSNYFRCNYVFECLNQERNISNKWDVNMIEQQIQIAPNTREEHKIINMHDTTLDLFPNVFFPQFDINYFTVTLAQKIHSFIGRNIIENAGKYRIKDARPAGESYTYLQPEKIDTHMNLLFKHTRQLFNRNHSCPAILIKLGTAFLEKFLAIHPFSNGNGRVGRLLLSYILSPISIVPVSLNNKQGDRDVFLQCLRESHATTSAALATFILESIHYHLDLVCFSLCENGV